MYNKIEIWGTKKYQGLISSQVTFIVFRLIFLQFFVFTVFQEITTHLFLTSNLRAPFLYLSLPFQ